MNDEMPPPAGAFRARSPRAAPRAVLRLALGILAAALWAAGCSTLERGTEKVVAKGLEAVNQPQNRTLVEDLLTSEEIQEATRELTGVVLDTALEDLTEEQRRERIREVAVEFVDELTPVLTRTFDDEVWPGIQEKLRESVTLTLGEVLSDETLERARTFAADTAREVIEATAPDLVETVSTGLSRGIENAFAAVLQGQVVPALEDFVGRDHGPAARDLARQVSHGAMLGVADAMNGELGVVFDRERDEIFDRLDESTTTASWRLKAALATGGAILLTGLILLILLRRGQRQREEAIDLLVGELRRQDGDPLGRVRDSGRGTTGGKYLERHLARH